MVVRRFRPIHLSTVPAFAGLTSDELDVLAASAEPRRLWRGEVLLRHGQQSDALYFVLSGRFSVETARGEPIAEIGQGQPIGEIGFFAHIPRTATVRALRDSHVLVITRERLQQISAALPQLHNAVISSLATRLATTTRLEEAPPRPRTMALVCAGDSRLPPRFVTLLRDVFGARSRAFFLTRQVIDERFPSHTHDDPDVSAWLNALESDFDFVVYVADETLTDWTQKCVRQADVLLLVATAGAGTALNPSEQLACSLHLPSARRLVVIHDARSDIVTGSAAWLTQREVLMHHHIALQDSADVVRLFRFISGRAVGFVASGGGAFGSAHLGVYKAFREIGVDFDIFGGTSVGAAMAAGLAAGADADRVDEGTHNIFVKQRSFARYTLPYFSLLNHKVFDRALQAEYGARTIEDLWRPFFAVSSNLSRNQIMVHRRGPLWEAVRASASIPGLLPPFFTAQGEMLVDGGIMDNVPLESMKTLKSGPNVIVALKPQAPTLYAVDYNSIPGLRKTLLAWLIPLQWRKRPSVPNILQVIMLSMVANRRQDVPLGETDMLIDPTLPPDFEWRRWEGHTEVFMYAYRGAIAGLSDGLARGEPCLAAILDALK
jgi:NTE family protein